MQYVQMLYAYSIGWNYCIQNKTRLIHVNSYVARTLEWEIVII